VIDRSHPFARNARSTRRRAAAASAVAFLVALAVFALPAEAATPKDLRVGSVTLKPCSFPPSGWCGSISVPLDYTHPGWPSLTISFEWFPATGAASGTVLAMEGGPGYSSIGSRYQYLRMLGPSLAARNLLLVDMRGTGTSSVVDCPSLERFHGLYVGTAFDQAVGACGDLLDHTWRAPGGGWIHAADLFDTANAARDTAAVLRALDLGQVDLYGDSYGSWFAQTFASRYPDMLRSVTLDSTYQVLGLDPWYVTTLTTARLAFDAACTREPACARAAPGSSWTRIAALAERLRRSPVTGTTTGLDGKPTRMRVTVRTLVDLVNNAGFDPAVYRTLDPAARALLEHGDAAPLLRLAAQSLGWDDANENLAGFSDGLFFATSCTDYPQLFSMNAPLAERARQYARALRDEPKGTFAPFTVGEWTRMTQYTEAYAACLDWPAPVHVDPPIVTRPPLVPPTLPVLVLSGDLDSLTPALHGARLVDRQMGPSARLVMLPNQTHVTAMVDVHHCASAIYRAFVADPGALFDLDTSCTKQISEIHVVGSFPERLAQAVPATPASGNTADATVRREAAVGVAAVGDEIARWPFLFTPRDEGLRGGSIRMTGGMGNGVTIRLDGVRWVQDATVDGVAFWNRDRDEVLAHLVVHVPTGPSLRMTATWEPFQKLGLAMVTGRAGGAHLRATVPAP